MLTLGPEISVEFLEQWEMQEIDPKLDVFTQFFIVVLKIFFYCCREMAENDTKATQNVDESGSSRSGTADSDNENGEGSKPRKNALREKSSIHIRGHHFLPHFCHQPTFCAHCRDFIWLVFGYLSPTL